MSARDKERARDMVFWALAQTMPDMRDGARYHIARLVVRHLLTRDQAAANAIEGRQ